MKRLGLLAAISSTALVSVSCGADSGDDDGGAGSETAGAAGAATGTGGQTASGGAGGSGGSSDSGGSGGSAAGPAECGSGLPLVISDLDIGSTWSSGAVVSGSVTYSGSIEDIDDPEMAYRIEGSSFTTSSVTSGGMTTSPCRFLFSVTPPTDITGSGTVQFKIIDMVTGFGSDPWDGGESNVLTQPVTLR